MNHSGRPLGWVTATALVVASMIGLGAFTTSGLLLEKLHSPGLVLIVWLAGGFIAALGALTYGALARQIPESGGEYLLLSRTLHPAAGYVAGWISLLVGFSAPLAAAAIAFGEYVKPWLAGCPPHLSGSVLVLVFATLHATHARQGASFQNAAVIVKVVLLSAFIAFAWFKLTPPTSATTADPSPAIALPDLAVSLLWVSFSYAGYNAAIYIAGEINRPDRNLPLALILGTGIVIVLYLGLNAVFLFGAPADAIAGKVDVGRIAAGAIGGPILAELVTALIALALISSVSSLLMAGPRVYARMAADGYLPRWFAVTSGPPRGAVALQGAIALAMLWTATFESLLTYIGFTLGLSTAGAALGLIRLRRRASTPFPVPGWPWLPASFLLVTLAVTTFSIIRQPIESALGLLTIAFGWLAWRLFSSAN